MEYQHDISPSSTTKVIIYFTIYNICTFRVLLCIYGAKNPVHQVEAKKWLKCKLNEVHALPFYSDV